MGNPSLPPVPPLGKDGFADPVWQRWLNLLRGHLVNAVVALSINTANGFSGSVAVDSSGSAKVTLNVTFSGIVKASGGGLLPAVAGTDYITGIAATAPLSQSGGATPTVSMTQSSSSMNGWL